ncbi:methyltransferase [Coprinopsis cinerea okayama7|uniref:Methyltransferase n=1 Tax=Coprinopsis cinerea (strain Okayama-7 / 130 / ATCC MYA-4618 / FGSC 9003) TaxID=240176 RepID=D6RJP5_COPC7|nr:methyltransferase [Coprinopsis cinerea okayama7\|eukprot:XP_002912118.1 methyltransferase [Coprinopsis cinerea okayama7\
MVEYGVLEALASKLVSAARLKEGATILVSLVNADAISDGAPDHPLSPTTLFPPFDAILALDCAYHFNSRRLFLEQSFARLNPGGRIALADICFSKNDLDTFKTRLVTSLLRMMPLCNRVSLEEYQLHMQQTGYEEVEVEDITADVFSPFIAFLKTQGFGWWTFAVMLDVYENCDGITGTKTTLYIQRPLDCCNGYDIAANLSMTAFGSISVLLHPHMVYKSSSQIRCDVRDDPARQNFDFAGELCRCLEKAQQHQLLGDINHHRVVFVDFYSDHERAERAEFDRVLNQL